MTHISNIRRGAVFAGLAMCFVNCVPASATMLDTNLILNGGAEGDTGASSFGETVTPTDWITTGNFSAVQYSIGSAGDLNTADSTAVGGALNYFAGGPNNALATASQLLDISDLGAAIDAGSLTAVFEALIGGFATQSDNLTAQAIFLDASSDTLLTLALGPVTPADRSNESMLLPLSANAAVPIGTRSINILLTAVRLEGSYNDGYADNLSLVLTGDSVEPVPEPGTFALLGLGLLGLCLTRRRAN